MAEAAKEAIWLMELNNEILENKIAIEIKCDNKSAIDLTKTIKYSSKTKHISVRHYFLKDLVESKEIFAKHISTDVMIADNLTKAVPIQKHNFCMKGMGLKI